MEQIHNVIRGVFRSWYLLPLVVFLLRCDDSDEVAETVCTKDLRIAKVLPDRNPIAAPILIVGNGFSNSTKVTFKEMESEITVVNDSTITTSAPAELKGSVGLMELSVIDGSCKFTTGFTLTSTFDDIDRPSPPTIFFPDPAKKVVVNIQDTIVKYSSYSFDNIWGDRQTFEFNSYDVYNEDEFKGQEYVRFGTVTNSLWCRVNPDERSIEVKTHYDDSFEYIASPGDHLAGGFYKMTMQTRYGMASGTFLFLQSTLTGRQYIFKSNK
jgi:hypothetical protein